MPVTSASKAAKPTAKPKTDAPAAKPQKKAAPKLVGTPYESGGTKANIFDATKYVEKRFEVGASGKVHVFHHAYDSWGTPGKKAWVSTKYSGGCYGQGFYTARKPETMYGSEQFQLEIPVAAFKGKKIVELKAGANPYDDFKMPPGVDILAVSGGVYGERGQVWLIFKKGSDAWLNKSATEADWDTPNQTDKWD